MSINSPALARKLAENPQPIRPKGGRRYLAIPASAVAANWTGSARDFPGGLRLAYSKTFDGHWLPSLVAASNFKRVSHAHGGVVSGGKSGANDVVFWLVHKTNPRRDKTAMPTRFQQQAAASAAVHAALRSLMRG